MARTARSSSVSPPDRRQALATVGEVLRHTIDLLIDMGCTPQELKRELADLCRKKRPLPTRVDLFLSPLITQLGDLLQQWHSDPQLLDENGEPRSLPYTGRERSLSALMRRVVPDTDPRDLLRMLVRTRSVRKRGSRYVPIRRFFSTAEISPMAHAQSLDSMCGLLQTVKHNVACKDPAQRLFERQAFNSLVPVRLVPEVHRFLKLESHALLVRADAFLAHLEVPAGSEPTTSIHLVTFVHERTPATEAPVRKMRAKGRRR